MIARRRVSNFRLRALTDLFNGMRRPSPWTTKRRLDGKARSDSAEPHHHVYVVLLDPAAAQLPDLRKANPKRDPRKPCLYVGMTGLPPAVRFENHRRGYKAAAVVCRFGIRLMPELYQCLNPMPFAAAAEMEKDLAEDLRAQGYIIAGGY